LNSNAAAHEEVQSAPPVNRQRLFPENFQLHLYHHIWRKEERICYGQSAPYLLEQIGPFRAQQV
jgi:hypothetical protein